MTKFFLLVLFLVTIQLPSIVPFNKNLVGKRKRATIPCTRGVVAPDNRIRDIANGDRLSRTALRGTVGGVSCGDLLRRGPDAPFSGSHRNDKTSREGEDNKEGGPTTRPKGKKFMVANKSRAASFMLYWPMITTFTVVSGWDEATSAQRFKEAVDEVVRANPILTGHVTQAPRFLKGPEIRITPGTFPPEEHDFVRVAKLPEDVPSPKGLEDYEILRYVDDHLSRHVEKGDLVIEHIRDKTPLFSVTLIPLPDNHACYVVSMSHCIGDGVTYYNIMEQINTVLNGETVTPKKSINWDHPSIPTHEIYPPRSSQCDIQNSYGLPFFLGIAGNALQMWKQKKGYFVLSKEKVAEMRTELVGEGTKYLSANDVITSALCQANKSSDVFAFTRDMRGRERRMGGNYHCEVPFLKRAAHDPNEFRHILSKGRYYERDRVPLLPFLRGRCGRITSLATVEKWIETDTMKVVAHCLSAAYVGNLPMDVAFIVALNREQYCVVHNFRQVHVDDSLLEAVLDETCHQ